MVKGPDHNLRSQPPVTTRPDHLDRLNYSGNGDRAWKARKSSDEIRVDIDRTRQRLDHTIDELQERLSVPRYLHAVFDVMRDNAGTTTRSVATVIRKNPLPIALIGAGIIWLAISQARQRSPIPRPKAITVYEEEQVFCEAPV